MPTLRPSETDGRFNMLHYRVELEPRQLEEVHLGGKNMRYVSIGRQNVPLHTWRDGGKWLLSCVGRGNSSTRRSTCVSARAEVS